MIPISGELIELGFEGERLHGLYCQAAGSRGTIIFVHGSAGNFYYNPFIRPLVQLYLSRSWSVLLANFPGFEGTVATEDFTAFPRAFQAWMEAAKIGENVVIQGHSLGALKALYGVKHGLIRPARLILLSPFDIVAFYLGGDRTLAEERLAKVESLQASGGPAAAIPPEIFSLWPMGAKTFLQLTEDGGPADVFPSRKSDLFEEVRRNLRETPTLICIGGKDFAPYPSPSGVFEMLKGGERDVLCARLFPAATHSFPEAIAPLVEEVSAWLG